MATGINPANDAVSVGLRKRLRARGRMFTLDDFIPQLLRLAESATATVDGVSAASDLDSRLLKVRSKVDAALISGLREQVDHKHMEELAMAAAERLFPDSTKLTAGPLEKGADVVVERDTGPFNLRECIVIQVKNWYSDGGTAGLAHICSQLRQAIETYDRVTAAVAFTLLDAEDVAHDAVAMEPFAALEAATGVQVRVLSKQDVIELVLPVLIDRTAVAV